MRSGPVFLYSLVGKSITKVWLAERLEKAAFTGQIGDFLQETRKIGGRVMLGIWLNSGKTHG